jgi:hypothetical protein
MVWCLRKICEECGGRKIIPEGDYVICPRCLGTGFQKRKSVRNMPVPGINKLVLIALVISVLSIFLASGQARFKMLFFMILVSCWGGIFFACSRTSRFFSFVARKFSGTPKEA